MQKLHVMFDNIDQLSAFSVIAEKYPADIDAKKGRYRVNGKSLMCLLALNCICEYVELQLLGERGDNEMLIQRMSERGFAFHIEEPTTEGSGT